MDLPLLAYNTSGELLKLLELGHTARQTFVVRVAIDVTPLLMPLNIALVRRLGELIFHLCGLNEELPPRHGSAR